MENRKKHNETKLPHLLNPINTIFRVQTFNTFIMKQFVRVNSAEYSTNFDFFVCHQVHVIHHLDNTTSFCSRIEKKCFEKSSVNPSGEQGIMDIICNIHSNILSLKYGGEFIL